MTVKKKLIRKRIWRRVVYIALPIIVIAGGFSIEWLNRVHNDQVYQKYHQAAQIDNDAEAFHRGMNDNIGGVFAKGTLMAATPVTNENLNGLFTSITVKEYDYQEYGSYRFVSSGWSKSKEWEQHSQYLLFLAEQFPYEKFILPKKYRYDVTNQSMYKNYEYYVLDMMYSGIIYATLKDGTAVGTITFIQADTFDEAVDYMVKNDTRSTGFMFWTEWTIIIIACLLAEFFLWAFVAESSDVNTITDNEYKQFLRKIKDGSMVHGEFIRASEYEDICSKEIIDDAQRAFYGRVRHYLSWNYPNQYEITVKRDKTACVIDRKIIEYQNNMLETF